MLRIKRIDNIWNKEELIKVDEKQKIFIITEKIQKSIAGHIIQHLRWIVNLMGGKAREKLQKGRTPGNRMDVIKSKRLYVDIKALAESREGLQYDRPSRATDNEK